MKIIRSLNKHIPDSVVTIGNFDGVHLGHQSVLKKVVDVAKQKNRQSVVVTFENHPSTILKPAFPVPIICSVKHKLKLFEKMGIDYVVLLPFTKDFAQQSADEFLQNLFKITSFSDLILGDDAVIGKNREGDPSTLKTLSSKFGFQVTYLPQVSLDGKRVTSTLIRDLISVGKLEETEKYLGRRYSIFETVTKGLELGRKLKFPTANFDVAHLKLPPLGVYVVQLALEGELHNGVANLGIAPTVRYNNKPVLEVHLFDFDQDIYGKEAEVTFNHYLRPEIRFESVDQLVEQIAKDAQEARSFFETRFIT